MNTREDLKTALVTRLKEDLETLEKPNVALYDVIRKLLMDLQHDADRLPEVEDGIPSAPFQFRDSG